MPSSTLRVGLVTVHHRQRARPIKTTGPYSVERIWPIVLIIRGPTRSGSTLLPGGKVSLIQLARPRLARGGDYTKRRRRRARGSRLGARACRYRLPAAGAAPVLVRRHLFADDVEEVERAHLAEELEALAQVFHAGLEVAVRAKVALEAAVLLLEVQHLSRVVNDRLDLAAVADDARVGAQLRHLGLGERSDFSVVEAAKGVVDARPLVVDDLPGDAGLEDGLAHYLQVIARALGDDLLRRVMITVVGGLGRGHLVCSFLRRRRDGFAQRSVFGHRGAKVRIDFRSQVRLIDE